MPGPVYKDSLARSEPPSMLFDTIRNPNAPSVPPQKVVMSPDTIESTQSKLNKEMIARFQGQGKVLSHDNYVAVVQVGKYMFLAVMLPPYLLLYGLPKWFMLNMLPNMYMFMRDQSVNVGRYVQQLSKQITDIMKGLIDQMIGDSLRMMAKKGHDISKFLSSSFNKGVNAFKDGYQAVVDKTQALLKSIFTPFHMAYNKVSDAINYATDFTRDMAGKLANGLSSGLLAAGQPVVNLFSNLSMPTINFPQKVGSGILQWARDGAGNVATSIMSILEGVRDGAKIVASAALEKSLKEVRKITDPVVEALQKSYQFADHHVRHITQQIVDNVSAKAHAAAQMVQQVPDAVVQAAFWFWGVAAKQPWERVRRSVNRAREWGRSGKRFLSALKKGGGYVSRKLHSKVMDLASPVITMWQWIAQFWAWLKPILWREFIELPQRVIRGAIKLFGIMKSGVKRLLHGGRVVLAWVNAVVHCGFQLLKESVAEIKAFLRSI